MSLAPLIPDPALAEDEWPFSGPAPGSPELAQLRADHLAKLREQINRANAAMPEIVARMNAEYRKAQIGRQRRPRREMDPSVNYIPGFEEDWTIS